MAAACGGGGAGPLGTTDPSTSIVSGPVKRGQWFGTTIESARLRSGRPAILDSIMPTDRRQAIGLRFRSAAVAAMLGALPGAARGWPPRGVRLAPVEGFVVHPRAYAMVVVGFAGSKLGRWRITEFTIRYHVGSTQYAATFRQGLAVTVVRKCRYC